LNGQSPAKIDLLQIMGKPLRQSTIIDLEKLTIYFRYSEFNIPPKEEQKRPL
jgi:exosome complex RNA-binding protein Rrp42 (RNase PH superfamily)